MALVNFTQPKFHVDDDNGNPLDSGKVYTYEANTSTFKATYQDIDGSAQNSNPVILDSRGEADIFLEDGLYKFVIKDKEDTTIWTRDSIIAETSVNDTIVGSMASLLVAPRAGCMRTTGFYSAGDGGGMLFHWNGDEPKINHNGVTIIDPDTTIAPGDPGWWTTTSTSGTGCWVATDESVVNCRTAGAKGDGVNDDAPACQACATWAATTTLRCYLPAGNYLFKSTVVIPVKVTFYGDKWNTKVYPAADGVFTNAFVISYNSTDCVTWDSDHPSIPLGGIHSVSCDDSYYTPTSGANFIFAAGGCEIKKIKTRGFNKTVAVSGDYGDNVQINNISAIDIQGIDYPIEIGNLGDNLSIHHIYTGVSSSQQKLIKITNCNGGRLCNFIQGDIELHGCSAFTVSNGHLEAGKIIVYACKLDIRNMLFYDSLSERIQINSSTYGSSSVSLNDCCFMRLMDKHPSDITIIDVSIDDSSSLLVTNCTSVTSVPGRNSDKQYSGIVVGLDSTTVLYDWMWHSGRLSVNGNITRGRIVPKNFTIGIGDYSDTALIKNGVNLYDGLEFQLASNTYYYRVVAVYDVVRHIGIVDPTEYSLAISNGGDVPALNFGIGSNIDKRYTIRLYRGTATGAYDYTVDIPCVNNEILFDTGEHINGFPWNYRGGAYGVGSFVTAGSVQFLGQTAIATTDSSPVVAPTAGTWQQGDQIITTTPTSGGHIGLVCTAGGSPGTWTTFGAIT